MVDIFESEILTLCIKESNNIEHFSHVVSVNDILSKHYKNTSLPDELNVK